MATYYISSSLGDNARTSTQAQNAATPWKHHPWDANATLAAQAYVCQPGDIFLFRSGDVWYDCMLTANDAGNTSSLITISSDSAYGSGELPELSASYDTSGWAIGWTALGDGVYSRALAADPNIAVANDLMLVKNTTTPTTPAAGQFGYASTALYVHLQGNQNPAECVWRVPKRNYVALIQASYIEASWLSMTSPQVTFAGAVYVDTETGIYLKDNTIKHLSGHGIYCDTPASCEIARNNVSSFRPAAALNGIHLKSQNGVDTHHNIVAGCNAGIAVLTGAIGTNKIRNNTISNLVTVSTVARGINIDAGTGVEVTGNAISNIGDLNAASVSGIYVSTNSHKIKENVISEVRGYGVNIASSATSNEIEANEISRCGYKNTAGDDFLYYGNGGSGEAITIQGTAAANDVSKNLCEDNYCGISISTTGGAGGNKIHHNVSVGHIVNGIGDYRDGNPTNRNLFYNNISDHSPSVHNTPAYTGHAFHAQDTSNGSVKAAFVNNTALNRVVDDSAHSFFVSKNSGTVSVLTQNNNWAGVGGAVVGYIQGVATRTDISDFVTDCRASAIFGDLAGVQANAESGTVSSTVGIDSDYRLAATSPCIGAGVDVGLTTDLDGHAIPGAVGYDIGPYSYMPGWTVSDGILPPSAQITKGHALPIGTGKITVFPGVASQAQIEEAK